MEMKRKGKDNKSRGKPQIDETITEQATKQTTKKTMAVKPRKTKRFEGTTAHPLKNQKYMR